MSMIFLFSSCDVEKTWEHTIENTTSEELSVFLDVLYGPDTISIDPDNKARIYIETDCCGAGMIYENIDTDGLMGVSIASSDTTLIIADHEWKYQTDGKYRATYEIEVDESYFD